MNTNKPDLSALMPALQKAFSNEDFDSQSWLLSRIRTIYRSHDPERWQEAKAAAEKIAFRESRHNAVIDLLEADYPEFRGYAIDPQDSQSVA